MTEALDPEQPKEKSAWENDSTTRHWVNHAQKLAVPFNAAHELGRQGPAEPAWQKAPEWLMRKWYERQFGVNAIPVGPAT